MIATRKLWPFLVLLPCAAIAADPPPWDVGKPLGPGRELVLSLDEGTWMSVDLHPSGDRFVFDLLGDIWELPIGGGAARLLLGGPAWDCEPRYSPDGASLLFTSDRAGASNLFLAAADGTKPRPLTRLSPDRVRDGAFSPDGELVAGVRRATDTSSIGTNELWLWDRLGGDGIALTSKDAMAGIAEPAFSPDGRFLYFSGRPGRFAYNADPNAGIWQIYRYDRTNGEQRPLTGEFGGAARPTPSPDGRQLLVVRRVRNDTVLERYDLASGARTQVASGLDRDGQEGFATNGVYPRFDWFPDGKRVLIAIGGGFATLDVGTGARTPIPFTLESRHFVADAVRPERRLPSEFQARLIRWPVLSPDGSSVMFSAVSSLYRADVRGGASTEWLPPGLPASIGVFSPSYSVDGRFVTFATWDDADGGAVWVAPAFGPGPARKVTASAARYTNPSFSPDGLSLIAIRGSGSWLRGAEMSGELWADLVTIDLGKPGAPIERVVTSVAGMSRAVRPRFSADGLRVLFSEEKETAPREAAVGVLWSVNLDGTDRRELLRVAHATEIVPSPDGRWVAYQDGHHAWLARTPEGKRPLEIGAGSGAVPSIRLSEHGGDWVDFAQRGSVVTWSFGPEIHTLPLADAAAFLEARIERARAKADADKRGADGATGAADGAETPPLAPPDEPEEPEFPASRTIPLRLTLPVAAPHGFVAYASVRAITMRGDEVLEDATVVTDGARIVAVGPRATVAIPDGAKVIDGSGLTLLPGYIDVHAHLHFSAQDVLPEQDWRHLANLAYGVTTSHDPSAFSDEVFTFGERIAAGRMIGPRVLSTGEILYGASGNFRSEIATREDAKRHVLRMKQIGAFSIKSYQQPRRDQRQWLVEEARAAGILVVPEGGGDLFGNMTMVLDGHTSIEHALPVAPLHDDVTKLFASSGTAYTPTLLVCYGGQFAENRFHADEEVWADEKLARFTPREVLERFRRAGVDAPDDDWFHVAVASSAKDILRAGGLVTLGAHGQLQGLGVHWEIEALMQGGMTAMEALAVATRNGARYLGLSADLGSIEPGKVADFQLIAGDPRADIKATRALRYVVKDGFVYDATTLERLGNDPAPAPARPR